MTGLKIAAILALSILGLTVAGYWLAQLSLWILFILIYGG